jgi:hypothetical protein
MVAATGKTPSQRWHAIEMALYAHGFGGHTVLLREGDLDEDKDQVPYGIVTFPTFRGSFRDARADLESVFEEHGMTVIDIDVCGDDFERGRFSVWFHPRERLGLLSHPTITLASTAQRLRAVTERLKERGVVVVEHEECETAYGPHGRLVLRRTVTQVTAPAEHLDGILGLVKEKVTRTSHEKVELVLGPWGWTSRESGLWLQPPSSTSTAELDNLVVTDMGIAANKKVAPPFPTGAATWEDVAGAVIAVNILTPFVQAFMTKAGEDSYQAFRKFMSNHVYARRRTRLHDPDTDTDLVFDPPLPDEALVQLAGIKPAHLKNCIAEWDQESKTWKISHKPRRKT